MKPNIIIFSGAGMSAESGISTFTGNSGLWNNNKISEICNYSTWIKNYDIVHNFYDELRCDISNKQPHSGFDIFHKLTEIYNVTHFTTNIDDLYEKSGLECVHIHGELKNIVCMTCNKVSDIGYFSIEEAIEKEMIFHNENCEKSLLKPAITFYNENYSQYPGFSLLKNLIKNIDHDDVFVIVGSSLQVIPVDYWLRHKRCHKYNINPIQEAGYGKDYKHWKNIKNNASDGLENLLEILKEYN